MEIQIIPIHLSYSHSNFKSHALNFQAFLRHLPEYFNAAPRSDNFFLLELLFCQIPYSPTEIPSATCAVTEEASLKLLCQFYFNVQIIASLFLKVSYSNALLLSSGIPHVNIYHFNTDVLEVAVPYLPFTGHYWTCRQWMTFRPDTFLILSVEIRSLGSDNVWSKGSNNYKTMVLQPISTEHHQKSHHDRPLSIVTVQL